MIEPFFHKIMAFLTQYLVGRFPGILLEFFEALFFKKSSKILSLIYLTFSCIMLKIVKDTLKIFGVHLIKLLKYV